MKSQWDVIYAGSHTNKFIKKLKRHLDTDISSIEIERLEYDGKKLERATFLIQHSSSNWNCVIEETFILAQRISGRWQLNLELPSSIKGYITVNTKDYVETIIEAPSNLESIGWELNRNQKYSKTILSSDISAW